MLINCQPRSNPKNSTFQAFAYGIRDDKVDLADLESVRALKISLEILEEIEEDTRTTMKEYDNVF